MRQQQYDLLKGIGIILVLIGHANVNRTLFTDLYLFHMPLFFMASGCFFKLKEGESFGSFLKKKAMRLLVPYLFFLAIFIGFNLLSVVLWPDESGIADGIKGKLIQFAIGLTGQQESLAFRTLWFLICLFEVFVVYWCLAHIKSKKARTAVSFAVFLVGYALQVFKIDIPFFIDSTLTVQFFFHLGWLFRVTKWSEKQFSPIVSVVSLVIIFLVFNQLTVYTDYRTNLFELSSVPIMLLIVWNLYNICLWLGSGPLKDSKLTSGLNKLGIESMLIYGLHRNFFIMIEPPLEQAGVNEYLISVIMVPVAIGCILLMSGWLHKHIPTLIGE